MTAPLPTGKGPHPTVTAITAVGSMMELFWCCLPKDPDSVVISNRFAIEDSGLALMRHGMRPVGLAECLGPASCAEGEDRVRKALGGKAAFVRRPADQPGLVDLLYGPEEADVREAARVLDELLQAKTHRPDLIKGMGAYLGYPACCLEAFCELNEFEKRNLGWAYARLRAECPDPVDPRQNPFTGLKPYHLPCGPNCAETLALIDAAACFMSSEAPAMLTNELAISTCPIVFSLGSFPSFSMLLGGKEQQPGTLTYQRAIAFGGDPAFALLAKGNRLEIHEGDLSLFSGNVPIGRFVDQFAVWWWRKAFDHEYWLGEVMRRAHGH